MDQFEYNVRELTHLVNILSLTGNLRLLKPINEITVRIAMQEEVFDLLTNLDDNGSSNL